MLDRKIQGLIGLKAVFYARVSTAEEEQLNAIELQIEENRQTIKEMGWELVDEYIDRGKSGTQTKRRDEYKRLYEDISSSKFEVICVKDQERLMRNTKDWYLFVERLVSNGKKLYFYMEGKFFTPADDALITGIKAIMAEEYSRNLSKKQHNYNNWRLEKARQGDTSISLQGSGNAYGWDKKDGKYTINPEQFKIRRLMCELVMKRKGSTEIAKILNDVGYRNSVGNKWKATDIPKFVYDIKNVGTLILNRETYLFDTKERIINPESEWIYLENAIPPVVTPEEWQLICKIREERTVRYGTKHRGKKCVGYFNGKIICGVCGAPYWRKQKTNKKEEYWTCSVKKTHGRKTIKRKSAHGNPGEINPEGCDNVNISKLELLEIFKFISQNLSANKEIIKRDVIEWLLSLKESIIIEEGGYSEEDLQKEVHRKDRLLDTFLDGIISKEDYQRKLKSIEDKILIIEEDIHRTNTKREDVKEIDDILSNIDEEVSKYIQNNNALKMDFLLKNFDKILVYPDGVIVSFPVIKRGVIVPKFPLVSGKESFQRQTEIINIGELTYWNKKFKISLNFVA